MTETAPPRGTTSTLPPPSPNGSAPGRRHAPGRHRRRACHDRRGNRADHPAAPDHTTRPAEAPFGM